MSSVFEIQQPIIVRYFSLDFLRGLAIMLMVLDHAVLVLHGPLIIHDTITRLAMPLFMLVAGHLWKEQSPQRTALIFTAATAAALPQFLLGLPVGNILFVYVVCAAVMSVALVNPSLAVLLAVVQFAYFPMPSFGYQPGLVLLIMLAGYYLPVPENFAGLSATRLNLFLGNVGLHPLAWYVGHLYALLLIVWWLL